jgi:hypothetical protein
MADAAPPDAERRKWMIVGGLALSFIVVLWVQLSPEDEAAPPAELADRPKRPAAAGAATSREWPRFELEQVLRHNPFTPLPKPDPPRETAAAESEPEGTAAGASAAETAAAVSNVQSKRVRAIFMTERGPAALVGTTVIHEGDVIDGMRVVAIQADGVIVEPK